MSPFWITKAFFSGFVLAAINSMMSPPGNRLAPVAFSEIEGWRSDNHAAALLAFRDSCAAILGEARGFERPVLFGGNKSHWTAVCETAQTARDPRAFFEANFVALRVIDPDRPEGLFTGYYEPEAQGSRTKSGAYQVPIYRTPNDLVAFDEHQEAIAGYKYGRLIYGIPQPYFTRREIEEGALDGRGLEIAWLKNWADAFFIHVQGSGRIRLPDGALLRLAFGAKSGRPYAGIGGLLVERGAFSREDMSMQATRSWMAANERAARSLMWENQSFIFFREIDVPDENLGPPGAQHVSLTPQRSLAVDRSLWLFGTPVWLDTAAPAAADGAMQSFRHLLIAQDTGTAIRGAARGDVFWGAGADAAWTAGHMKSPGTMIVLLPHALAKMLLASQ